MHETDREIKIRNKSYPLLFNVAALKQVSERYGGIEQLADKLEADKGKAINEYTWILALLINQGIALRNFEEGTNDKAVTPELVELLMKPKQIYKSQGEIIGAINEGMSDESDTTESGEVDEVLEEVLASKNEMGARG